MARFVFTLISITLFFFGQFSNSHTFYSIKKGNVTAATDIDTLKLHNITSILTVDSVPLAIKMLQLPTIKNKYVQGMSNHLYFADYRKQSKVSCYFLFSIFSVRCYQRKSFRAF